MTSRFEPKDARAVARLIADYPLAWVVSLGSMGEAATPLPLIGETDVDGKVRALIGHFGRSNPQLALVARQPRAMILFQGPQGYIPPRLVSDTGWAPTWCYAVARFDVDIQLTPGENRAALAALAASLERDRAEPWTPERMGERYDQLERHIVAFRAEVRATHARFKLGQDEPAARFTEIVVGLGDTPLARWMTDAASP